MRQVVLLSLRMDGLPRSKDSNVKGIDPRGCLPSERQQLQSWKLAPSFEIFPTTRLDRGSSVSGVVCAQIFSGKIFTPTFFAADRSSLSSVARDRFVRIANSR